MQRESLLVTGASALLLRRLIARIDRSRFRVFGLTRQRSRLADLQMDIDIVEGDLLDASSIRRAVEGMSFVIHGAALTHSHDPNEYLEVNVRGTETLVSACCEEPAFRRFALISSRTAGEHSGHYGRSKLRAEEVVRAQCDDWCIVRPAEVFGSGKGEGVDRMLQDSLTRRLVICPAGLKARLYPIHVDDAAMLMHRFLFEQWQPRSCWTLNGREGFTVVELVRYVARVTGRRVVPVPVPRFCMFLIAALVARSGVRTRFVPDQVPRLYSPKPVEHHDGTLRSLREYLSALVTAADDPPSTSRI